MLVFGLFLALLLAIACGGDDDSPGEPGDPTPVPTGVIQPDSLTGRIAFTSNRDSISSNIWVMNADGSGQTRLTDDPAPDIFPHFSPDGRRIVFQRGADIWVMDADGSKEARLFSGGSYPRWSPDGRTILFSHVLGNQVDLATIDADGSGFKKLTEDPSTVQTWGTWSPDGGRIVYMSAGPEDVGLYIRTLDGSVVQQVTSESVDQYPDWLPDGARLAYAMPRLTGYGIAAISPDGTEKVELTADDTWDSFPVWSPDGCCLAFVSTRGDGKADVFVMRSDGSGVLRLTDHPADDGAQGLSWAR